MQGFHAMLPLVKIFREVMAKAKTLIRPVLHRTCRYCLILAVDA
jgi:hypothetical protein